MAPDIPGPPAASFDFSFHTVLFPNIEKILILGNRCLIVVRLKVDCPDYTRTRVPGITSGVGQYQRSNDL